MSYCTLSGCVSRRPVPPISVGKPAPSSRCHITPHILISFTLTTKSLPLLHPKFSGRHVDRPSHKCAPDLEKPAISPCTCHMGLSLDHFINSSPAATQRCISQPHVAPLFFSCTDQWLSEQVSTCRWLDFILCMTGPTFFPSVLLVPAPHESPSSHKYAHMCTILCTIIFRTIRSCIKSNQKLNLL